MIKSMTGYGSAKGTVEGIEVSVELKSVNNKFLDTSIRLPRSFLFAEETIKQAVSSHISRGKVDVFVTIDTSMADDMIVRVNEPLLKGYLDALNSIADKYGLANDASVMSVSRLPDVLSVEKKELDADAVAEGMRTIAEQALCDFDRMRIVEGEKLKAFLSNLPETVCLLFIEEKVEKNNALYKAVVKNGQAVEFKKQAEKDLGTWIKQRCKANGMQMSDGVLNLFLQTVDHDMENLDGELQKLIAYKGEKAEIRAEDIRAVCTVSLEARVFDLVKAVAEKHPERAVQIYRTLLSMKESPYMVLSLITRQFRLILETMLLTQNGLTQEQIAARLELREFAVKEYQRQSKRFPVAGWKQAVRDCLQADLDIKSGRASEETAVELLIMKYAA